MVAAVHWYASHRFDRDVRPIADRHYNRQKIGSPQFVPPGRCVVLRMEDAEAFWVTSWPFAQFTKHRWAGAWVCSAFRNESAVQSSALITEAVAVTRATYPTAPAVATWMVERATAHVTYVRRTTIAMVTFVDARHVRPKRDLGRCYLHAGFRRIGETRRGLTALGLETSALPEPRRAASRQHELVCR